MAAAGATAGVLVLGAGIGAAVAFGNVAGTMQNIGSMSDFGGLGGFNIEDFVGDITDCSCCEAIPCVVSCGCSPACWPLGHNDAHNDEHRARPAVWMWR